MRLWGEGGPTLLEHTLSVLAPLCADLIVVLNDPQAWPQLQATLVGDVYPDAGVLGGIATGLRAARHDCALVVAADMPLLHANLLAAMLVRPRTYQALVPRTPQLGKTRNASGVEPLHAVYCRACLPVLHTMLGAGQRRVVDFLAQVQVEFFELDADFPAYDHESFMNINMPEDLAAVQARLQAGGA